MVYTHLLEPSYDLFATGVGGVLYPPDILKISNNDLNDINKSILNDDVFLKYKENKLDVKVVYTAEQNDWHQCLSCYLGPTALWRKNVGLHKNDEQIRALNIKRHQD